MGLVGMLRVKLGEKEFARRMKIAEDLFEKDYPRTTDDDETRRTNAWGYVVVVLSFPQHGVRDFKKHDGDDRKKFVNEQFKKGIIPPVPPRKT